MSKKQTLNDSQVQSLEKIIEAGNFDSVSDALDEAIRLLEARVALQDRGRSNLRALIDEALDSGEGARSAKDIWASAEARRATD